MLPFRSSQRLQSLAAKYSSNTDAPAGEAFIFAHRRYLRRNRESLFDVTLAATSAHIGLSDGPSDVDPLLLKAIYQTNPSLTETRLFSMNQASMQGAVNSAKGTYFEYLVVDKLNNGEQVGPLLLDSGQVAVLAELQNQPGWDIRIVDEHGGVVDYLQLKATSSIGYIKAALERYPDIEILATTEVAQGGLVLDSGISEMDLRAQVGNGVAAADVSLTESFLDYFSPLVPLCAIAAHEGYRLCVGSQSIEQFKNALSRRAGRVVAAPLVGATVYALGGGYLALPATFAGGMLYDRYINQAKLQDTYQSCRNRLLALRLLQQDRVISQGDSRDLVQ